MKALQLEISHCDDCPYFKFEHDVRTCRLLGEEVSWGLKPGRFSGHVIPSNCPLPDKEPTDES